MTDRTWCYVRVCGNSSSMVSSYTLLIILLKKLITMNLQQLSSHYKSPIRQITSLPKSQLWPFFEHNPQNSLLAAFTHPQQQRIIFQPMNIASFLHAQKEYQDSQLPLPLAPVYELPQHRWLFSSHTLVPLRKRKENTSLFQYIERLQDYTQQAAQQRITSVTEQQILLCLYEKNGYLDDKIKHIFEALWRQKQNLAILKQKIPCHCCVQSEQSIKTFKMGLTQMANEIIQTKKQPRVQNPLPKRDQINWFEFTQNIVHTGLEVQFFGPDHLHIYKLPSEQSSSGIFHLLWSSSYIVFNNGNQPFINQHMKTKAVELAELVGKKVEDYLWRTIQTHIGQKVEEIEHAQFITKARQAIVPQSFRLWFYKKESNNQIYALAVTDLTLKGVDCVLYKDINLKVPVQIQLPTATLPDVHADMITDPVDQFLTNRIKTYSLQAQSHKSLSTHKRSKLHMIAESNLECKTLQVHKQSRQKPKQEPTDTQCVSCKNLLLSSEIVNEITAKHIKEIRYLRQIKMGKQEYNDYDFVKVCTQCYEAYLKCYKYSVAKAKEKKPVSFYDYKQKKEQSNDTAKMALNSSNDKKSKMASNSSQRLLRNKSSNARTRSELNTSKEHTEVDYISRRNDSVQRKPRVPTANVPSKYKVNKTVHTSNTDTLQLQPGNKIGYIRQEFKMERTLTTKEPVSVHCPKEPMFKSKSFKLRGRVSSKNNNLINKIILNTQGNEQNEKASQNSEFFDQNRLIKDQILTTAIHEYDNISRPSFKKLLYKNHRVLARKEIAQAPDENQQSKANWRRKSIKSYCEQ